MRALPLLFLIACGTTAPGYPTAQLGPPVGDCDSATASLDVGACAPDFELLNADGTPIRLADKVGERLVVVGASVW